KVWRTGIPHYSRITASNVYDGIDITFYANGGNLEYDFVVKPGADPRKIRLAFEGQEGMRVDKSGDLLLRTAGGAELRQARPKVYQEIDGKRVEVSSAYEMPGNGRSTFTLAAYNTRQPLVIDPIFTQPL